MQQNTKEIYVIDLVRTKMNSYMMPFIWPLVGSSLLTFCPLPVLMMILFIFTVLVHYLRQVGICFISPDRMALTYALMLIPFLTFFIFSIILDLLHYYVLTLEVPWMKILTVEGLGMSLVLFELFCKRKAYVVPISFLFKVDKLAGMAFPSICS